MWIWTLTHYPSPLRSVPSPPTTKNCILIVAFKYLDDSAMGVDLAVKQVVHFVHGRRRVLKWLGNPPKQRGRINKFFFRVGLTNKWTRIVLSYRVS